MTPRKPDHRGHVQSPSNGCGWVPLCQVYDGLPGVSLQSGLRLVNLYKPSKGLTFVDSSSLPRGARDPRPIVRLPVVCSMGRGRSLCESPGGRRVVDNPRPHGSRLQQGLATTNTTSTDTQSSRQHRDVGNVAKPERGPTGHCVSRFLESYKRNTYACSLSWFRCVVGGACCSRANHYKVPQTELVKSGAFHCQPVQPIARPSMCGRRAASGLTKLPSIGRRRQVCSRAWSNTGSPERIRFQTAASLRLFEFSIDVLCGAAGQDIRRCAQGSATTRPTQNVNQFTNAQSLSNRDVSTGRGHGGRRAAGQPICKLNRASGRREASPQRPAKERFLVIGSGAGLTRSLRGPA